MSLYSSWGFNENDTTKVWDHSGNARHSTSATGLTIVTSDLGKAGRFDGSTTWVQFGNIADFGGTANLNINIKFKIAVLTTTHYFLFKNNHIKIYINNVTRLITWEIYKGGGWTSQSTAATFLTATWYKLGLSYDGVNMKMYINAVIDATLPTTGNLTASSSNLNIGSYNDGASNFLNGDIETFEIRNAALTADNITALSNFPNGMKIQTTKAHSFAAGDLLIQDYGGQNIQAIVTLNEDSKTFHVIPVSAKPLFNYTFIRVGNIKDTARQYFFEQNITAASPTITIRDGISTFALLTDDSTKKIEINKSGTTTPLVRGGIASGNNLTLQSTSHAVKGKILFGTSAYDEVNDRLLIGNTTGTNDLHIEKNVNSAVNLYVLNPSTGVNSQVQMLFGIAGTGGQYCWVAHRGTNKTAAGILVANSSSFVGADINGTILGSINSGGWASTSFVAGGYNAENECMRIRSNGNISISGKSGSPFLSGAYLHFAAGTTAVNSAPVRFMSNAPGVLLTAPEVGAVEFLIDKLYFTITTGTTRKEFTLNDIALTSGRIPIVTTNGRLTDDADFTFAADTLTVTKIAAHGVTGNLTFADGINIVTNATTGTRIGTATTEKIGFWNVSPTTQYLTTGTVLGFLPVGGSAVFHTSTFTGNTGATAYTIGDIVRALKLCGIILE